MDRKPISLDEVEPKTEKALLDFGEGKSAESEQDLLELFREAKQSVERYFLNLQYAETLMKVGRWEESRDVLIRSAQIALKENNLAWLVFSHERLGDLSAAEESWFSALHHYRYGLRKASSFLNRPMLERLEAKANVAQSMLHSTILLQDTNIIALSREYSSENMAISFVQRDVFLKKYFARCLECNFCHDWCCSFGAEIDIRNLEKIQQQKEEILPFVRPPEGEWFESEYTYYEEYAGNQYTRINTQGPRCVFISKDQRGCGLHRYAISNHMDYHEIKPLVCILFPLSFEEGILSLAPELNDNSLVCSGSGYAVYQSMRAELEYYFGQELIEELDGMEKKVLGES